MAEGNDITRKRWDFWVVSQQKRAAVGVGLSLSATAALASNAEAADFVVDNTTDANSGSCTAASNDCSLRDAVDAANSAAGPDRVVFQSGLTGSIELTAGAIDIASPLQVLGPGYNNVHVDASGDSRIFSIDGSTAPGMAVTISGLRLRGGYVHNADGGAIRSESTNLTIADSYLQESRAVADSAPLVRGGGVAAFGGSLTVRGSFVVTNSVRGIPSAGRGGEIYAQGTDALTISDTYLGGGWVDASDEGFGAGIGAVDAGVVTIDHSKVLMNQFVQGGPQPVGSGLASVGAEKATIDHSTFSSNNRVSVGGAVYSEEEPLEVLNSTLSGNSADRGGGLASNNGSLQVENSTLSRNDAVVGGGVYSASGSLAVRNSTLSGNTAVTYGGGVESDNGSLAILGSTLANNQALLGGGAYVYAGESNMDNSILADNTAYYGAELYLASSSANVAFSLIEQPVYGGTLSELVPGSNKLGVDPQLGPLMDNGGPTETQRPALGGPAIDSGRSAGLTTDQRGSGRPFDIPADANAAGGDGSDIGAVELQPSELPPRYFSVRVRGKRLFVHVPTSGTVNASDSAARLRAKKKRKLLLNPSTAAGNSPTIVLPLHLTKLAKRKLRQKGKLTVRARLTFTPTHGIPNTRVQKLKLTVKK
jgi:CSLREA domain-containing protein